TSTRQLAHCTASEAPVGKEWRPSRGHRHGIPTVPVGCPRLAQHDLIQSVLSWHCLNKSRSRYLGTDLDVAGRGTDSWLQFLSCGLISNPRPVFGVLDVTTRCSRSHTPSLETD